MICRQGIDATDVLPTYVDVQGHFDRLHADLRDQAWHVRMMRRFGYLRGDAWYEATVDSLVDDDTSWLDVGGGKTVFPYNERLSAALSRRCALLVGVDPSLNINGNPHVHQRANCTVEEFQSERKFHLATLRMVAEHVPEPRIVVESLARLIEPGGRVVIFTPSRWSPVCVAASMIPFWLHKPLTYVVWGLKGEDTFPTFYRMNTRGRLRTLFEEGGFKEIAFKRLDNCATFQRFRVACFLELCLWWVLQRLRLSYPITELLGVYERTSAVAGG
jgi:2-polyprenyl-3-methyl-5-hydroxy-6-metoxy-1,4-benzoquinol methylase